MFENVFVRIRKSGVLIIKKLGVEFEQECPYGKGKRYCGCKCPLFVIDGSDIHLKCANIWYKTESKNDGME